MPNQLQPATWITSRRLRAHGIIVALCLWTFYGWNLATPGLRDRNGNLKGTDFLHFYTLGATAHARRGADLYNLNAQTVIAAQRVPQAARIRYLPLYPPQVSMFFWPLSEISYGWALLLWWVCSVTVYGLCCYSLWRACPNLRQHMGTVAILALAFPAFFHLIAWGQTSAVALACFTLTFFLLRAHREFLTGLVLGCLIFKPQLGVAAAVVFISIGAWKAVLGAALSAAAQLSAGVLYYGIEPLHRWMHILLRVRAMLPLFEPRLYETHSLRTFWSMLVPWHWFALGLYLLSAALVLGFTIDCWKRGQTVPFSLRYSALLFASVLVSPHLTVYDLVILAPAFILLADWLVVQSATSETWHLGTILYFAYMLPLVAPLVRWIHLQLSVIAMAAAVYVIWQVSHTSSSTGAPKSVGVTTVAET